MTRFLIRRLFWAMVVLLAVTMVTYVIFFVIPDNPARTLAGRNARPADIQRAAHFLGTDQPIYIQYLRFLRRLVWNQSLGFSFINRRSVNSQVFAAAPVTASVVIGGAIFWMALALPIGILSAVRPRSLLDRTAMVFVLIGISAHPVWIGYLLETSIGYHLGWTPINGYCDLFGGASDVSCHGPVPWFSHLILPWVTFMILFAALYVRMIRANVMETMNEDFVRTARSKGAPEHRVMRSHILRNAMLPVVTMLGMDIGLALGGAIFTETVYGLPGLGRLSVTGVDTGDLPLTMGVVVFASICVILLNLIVDIFYAYIDPRIRIA